MAKFKPSDKPPENGVVDAEVVPPKTAIAVRQQGGWTTTGDTQLPITYSGQNGFTFPLDSKEGVMRRERHNADETDEAENWINKTITIVAASLGTAEFEEEGGELTIVPRLVVETDEGQLVQVFSVPSVKSFDARLNTHILDGPLSASHPLDLVLVRRQSKQVDPVSKKPRSYYWFNRPE